MHQACRGKTPALYCAPLQGNHLKQDLICERKKDAYPHGQGIPGVWDLFTKDLDKPVEDRYTHQITTTPSGRSLIFTANSYLLNLVHTATGLHVDTTFKRAAGDHKEVEFAIWVPAVQCVLTLPCSSYHCSGVLKSC